MVHVGFVCVLAVNLLGWFFVVVVVLFCLAVVFGYLFVAVLLLRTLCCSSSFCFCCCCCWCHAVLTVARVFRSRSPCGKNGFGGEDGWWRGMTW